MFNYPCLCITFAHCFDIIPPPYFQFHIIRLASALEYVENRHAKVSRTKKVDF